MPNYTYKDQFPAGREHRGSHYPAGPQRTGRIEVDRAQQAHLGIHGTPEPAQIDKTRSHGCVRLINWDAEELGAMVAPGVQVVFS